MLTLSGHVLAEETRASRNAIIFEENNPNRALLCNLPDPANYTTLGGLLWAANQLQFKFKCLGKLRCKICGVKNRWSVVPRPKRQGTPKKVARFQRKNLSISTASFSAPTCSRFDLFSLSVQVDKLELPVASFYSSVIKNSVCSAKRRSERS